MAGVLTSSKLGGIRLLQRRVFVAAAPSPSPIPTPTPIGEPIVSPFPERIRLYCVGGIWGQLELPISELNSRTNSLVAIARSAIDG